MKHLVLKKGRHHLGVVPAPYKKWESYAEYRKSKCDFSCKDKLGQKNFFPCLDCRGTGEIRDGDPDPIEGYKLVGWIRCMRCAGSGSTSKNVFDAEYTKYLEEWEATSATFALKVESLRSACKKLKLEEIRLILEMVKAVPDPSSKTVGVIWV